MRRVYDVCIGGAFTRDCEPLQSKTCFFFFLQLRQAPRPVVIRSVLGIFIDGVRQYPFSEIVSFRRVQQGYVDSEDIGDQRNAAEPFEALCTKRPEARVARWKPRNDNAD